MSTYQLQHKRLGEFPIDHDREACEAITELLSSIQDSINLAIKDGAERVELRYHNIPDDLVNRHGDIGMVRVLAYRQVEIPQTSEA
jgi:hypothetical protein